MVIKARREFLQDAGFGLATVGAAGLVLRCDARPTTTVDAEEAGRVLIQMGAPPKEELSPKAELKTP